MQISLTSSLKNIAALTMCALLMRAELPDGWHTTGSRPQDYDIGIDSLSPYNGEQSTSLKLKEGIEPSGFGSLARSYSPEPYLGKRVRFSANVKAENVRSWAGLWMRVDDANHKVNGRTKVLSFDNMQSRAIKGSSGWKNYSIVLDVPEEATNILIGLLIDGAGAVWLNGAKLEIVGSDVATTGTSQGKPAAQGPTNLGFDK